MVWMLLTNAFWLLIEVVRAVVPKMNLDELFEQKGEVAKAVSEELEKVTCPFIILLLTWISPSIHEKHCGCLLALGVMLFHLTCVWIIFPFFAPDRVNIYKGCFGCAEKWIIENWDYVAYIYLVDLWSVQLCVTWNVCFKSLGLCSMNSHSPCRLMGGWTNTIPNSPWIECLHRVV